MKRKAVLQKETVRELVLCLSAAFVIMLLCTRSSFLYVFNNWDDANSYFSMGKAMFRGRVPYRDLFDQKGILLYFLYGCCYLISPTDFHGVFLMEVLAAAAAMLAMIRTAGLYVRRETACALVPIVCALIYASRSFWWGGSAEELMLPFLAWGLYLSVRHFKRRYPAPMPYREVFIGGVLAGCILHIKFNSLGFYFGWMGMVLIGDLAGGSGGAPLAKRLRTALCSGFIFLGGMGVATLPWLIYFGLRHAISDWLYVYLYLNVFTYSEKLPMAQRLYKQGKAIYWHIRYNPGYFSALIIGGSCFLLGKSRWIEKLNLLCLGGFLTLVIFIGGVDLPYYPLPIGVFAVLGAIAAGKAAEMGLAVFERSRGAKRRPQGARRLPGFVRPALLYALSLLCACLTAWRLSQNISFLSQKADDFWLFAYRDMIAASGIERPTLLNYNCFDAGLYTAADIVPTCRFYQTQTIHLKDVELVQWDSIQTGKTDFLLTRDAALPEDHPFYQMIAEREYAQNDRLHVYRLYQLRKETAAR